MTSKSNSKLWFILIVIIEFVVITVGFFCNFAFIKGFQNETQNINGNLQKVYNCDKFIKIATIFSSFFTDFCSIVFIGFLNIILCSEFVEGILRKDCTKMYNWIILNGFTLVLAAIYVVKIDSLIAFLVHVFFCTAWMAVVSVCIEMIREPKGKETCVLLKPDTIFL
jgi:hypothetical protein